jgi:hypothetical protein
LEVDDSLSSWDIALQLVMGFLLVAAVKAAVILRELQ